MVLALVGCFDGPVLQAQRPDAGGVAVGMPVEVAGVPVGAVESLRVAGDQVQVDLRVEAGHELDLRADACLDVSADAFVIRTGTSGELGEAPLTACAPEVPGVVEVLAARAGRAGARRAARRGGARPRGRARRWPGRLAGGRARPRHDVRRARGGGARRDR